jgi:hypothetical protein
MISLVSYLTDRQLLLFMRRFSIVDIIERRSSSANMKHDALPGARGEWSWLVGARELTGVSSCCPVTATVT